MTGRTQHVGECDHAVRQTDCVVEHDDVHAGTLGELHVSFALLLQ